MEIVACGNIGGAEGCVEHRIVVEATCRVYRAYLRQLDVEVDVALSCAGAAVDVGLPG